MSRSFSTCLSITVAALCATSIAISSPNTAARLASPRTRMAQAGPPSPGNPSETGAVQTPGAAQAPIGVAPTTGTANTDPGAAQPPVTDPGTAPANPIPPVLPPLPPAAVVLENPTPAGWLNAAGVPATVVSEAALPEALNNAVLAVIPVQSVRQTATVDALKAHLARGGRVLAVYWGPIGIRTSTMDAMASLLSVNVTGWSGKGNAAIVPTNTGRAFFSGLTRLKTGRPFAVVAAPVIPPAPPAPKPALPQTPKVNTGGVKPVPRPNANGVKAAAGVPAVAPSPAAPTVPPPQPPPSAVGRWVGDDGRPARRAPQDSAVVAAPGTLWIGEDIFVRENDTPEMRRWFAAASVALAPTLRLPAKQAALATAQSRLDALRAAMPVAGGTGGSLPVADAQRSLDAAAKSLASASAGMDFAAVLSDVAAANDALLDASAYLTPSRPVEVRAAWVEQGDLSKNIADIRRLVQRLADARFNVILPEVVYWGRAAYPSSVYPQDKRLVGFDPLRALIDEAHRRGMEVHPWVWTLAVGYYGEQGPLLKTHPEWAARDKAGRIMTDGDRLFWLSPTIPAARTAVRNVIREIAARYDVDGVHLDYARYHSPLFDYSDAARTAYQARGGADPLQIPALSAAAADWHAWREAQVNALVRDIHVDIEAVKPGLPLSAAVYQAPIEGRRERLQDWPNWAANNWVDWVVPMTYTSDPDQLSQWLTSNVPAAAGKTLLVPGLANARLPDTASLMAQVSRVRATPSQGVSMFAAGQLTDEMLRALRLGAFRTPAATPWKNPLLAARTLALAAADQLRAIPVADASAAVPVRAAINDLAAWAAGGTLPVLTVPPPSVASLSSLGPDFDEARAMVDQAVQIAQVAVASARPAGTAVAAASIVAPSAPPVPVVASPAPLPSTRVPVAMSVVSVDGRLDDAAWSTAPTLMLDRTYEGGRAPLGATVRLLRDATTLYVGFNCPEPNMAALKATVVDRDGPAYQDDSVEVFLSSSDKGVPYAHFVVSAAGGMLDDRSGDTRWGARWTSAVSRDAAAWSAEIAIPLSSVGGSPEGTWRANFARNRMPDGPLYLTWSVPYGNYHNPDRFGNLAF